MLTLSSLRNGCKIIIALIERSKTEMRTYLIKFVRDGRTRYTRTDAFLSEYAARAAFTRQYANARILSCEPYMEAMGYE